MQYSGLEKAGKEELLAKLEDMPAFLEAALDGLSAAEAVVPGPDGRFSPVEQCWHLADLERDGYGVRIRRLLAEEGPLLPDFDGARIAEDRQYRSLGLAEGLRAFREARIANLRALRSIAASDWERPGRQEGVGAMALCDVPGMMAEHDAGHRAEIESWMRQRGPSGPEVTPVPPAGQAPRVIVVGIIRNRHGDYLLCKMPEDRGVFPGEWGLPGGGLEPGETLEQGLRREIREELGIELLQVEPLFFTDATYPKTFPDGTRREIHMIFLLFGGLAVPGDIRLNPEFEAVAWVPAEKLASYRLNKATVGTFSRLGLLKG